MTALLELRENLKKIYSRNEAFILPVIKFLLSFIVLSIINGKMGYMTKLDNMAIVLIVSLLLGMRHYQVLLGLADVPSPQEMQQQIQQTVEIFLLKYQIHSQ